MLKWSRALFQPVCPMGKDGRMVTASSEHLEISRSAAAESMVLLKNENNVLPFADGTKLALFGKGTFDYVKAGGGSGDVTVRHTVDIYEGLKSKGERVGIFEELCDFYRENVREQLAGGAEPGLTYEPELPEGMLERAREFTDTAVITICRFSGEGWDRLCPSDLPKGTYWEDVVGKARAVFEDGDYNLTRAERAMVEAVADAFPKVVVVFNVGGVVDSTWFAKDARISSALMAWQGGSMGGAAMADVLMGDVNPSGRLADTFADSLDAYPSTADFHADVNFAEYTEDIYVGYRYFETVPGAAERVNYPFGFGLSYTTFENEIVSAGKRGDEIDIIVRVTNTGACTGRQVVQAYFSAPQGLLGKPARQLAAFAKTGDIAPGKSELAELTFAVADMASYDDIGAVEKSAYVLEKGEYAFYVGENVRAAEKVDYTLVLEENAVTEKLSAKCVPNGLTRRMLADGTYAVIDGVEPRRFDENALTPIPAPETEGVAPAVKGRGHYQFRFWEEEDSSINFAKVADGKASLDDFMAQLTDEQIADLLGGQPNLGVANTFGIGNLPEYGVPNIMTADGPAGLRVFKGRGVFTTAFPCAFALACTWNPETVAAVGAAGGREVKENNIDVWLTPAVNIHRSPLCGRNFEYYSEDPFLAGILGGAMVRGIQSENVAASVKHFACNNKETNRKESDSRVSERALREIYLKGFELIVKRAKPWTIMSSYNLINGCRASENRDLLTGILRDEWGYDGIVETDWWTRGEHYKELLAGNDLKMGCGYTERLLEALKLGVITRADMEVSARRILELILKIN